MRRMKEAKCVHMDHVGAVMDVDYSPTGESLKALLMRSVFVPHLFVIVSQMSFIIFDAKHQRKQSSFS